MEGFIDIHTHILPGVDDGAKDLTAALELIRLARADGTAALCLTPHYRGRYRKNSPECLRETFARLQESCPDTRLYLGCEVHYEDGVMDKLLAGDVLTLNGSDYVLLEFSPQALASTVLRGVDSAVNCGLVPIIAHAERYEAFRKQKALAEDVCYMGALLQLNADSILGKQGLGVKLCCVRLLKDGLVSFVASDAHDAAARPPLLRRCYEYLCKKYGNDYAAGLFFENARAVLENNDL